MTAMRALLAFLTLGSFLVVTQTAAQPAPAGPATGAPKLVPPAATAGSSGPPPAAGGPPPTAGGPPPTAGGPPPTAGGPPRTVGGPPPASSQSAPTRSTQNLAAARTGLVCTIFAGNFSLSALGVRITQYSTMGLVENCNEAHFNGLTTASIQAQFRAVQQPLFVVKGGSHRYLMDVNLATVPKPFIRVGDLMMSPVGYIDLPLHQMLLKNKGLQQGSVVASEYKPFNLVSNIHYIWNIGTPVHRLVSPNGDRYVMYGYTTRVIENVDRDNLALIGPLLNPPVGWKYESYLLDRTLTITADPNQGFVRKILFDDAYNMYIETFD